MNSIPVLLALAGFLSTRCAAADPESGSAVAAAAKDNQELVNLFNEDQADRQAQGSNRIDWQVVAPKDEARRKRVMELYLSGKLKTGPDYFHAGLILQHGRRPEDYLLCHELCVGAVFKSGAEEKAGWVSSAKQLAAASEDRFLLSIGRAQRFGTQFSSRGPDSAWHLDKLEEGVTDELRRILDVPPLAQAKEHEKELNKKEK